MTTRKRRGNLSTMTNRPSLSVKILPPAIFNTLKKKFICRFARGTNFIWGSLRSQFIARDSSSVISEIEWPRIAGWKNRFFSEGGREILLKAVIQAILTYAMSCFRIPTTILNDIEIICIDFWWGRQGSGKKNTLESLAVASGTKIYRWYGLQDLITFNKSLLAKRFGESCAIMIILYPRSLKLDTLDTRTSWRPRRGTILLLFGDPSSGVGMF